MMPDGAVTADQEIVSGSGTLAPLAGGRGVGVAGPSDGVTVRIAVFVTPPREAEIVTEVEAVTDTVEIEKPMLVAPAGTVTLAGTVATVGVLLESVTTVPPVGAAPVRVAVPFDVLPPSTLVGLRVSVERAGPVGVQPDKVARAEEVPSLTVITQDVDLKPSNWILNAPVPSAFPRATPSMLIEAFGTASLPWTRSCPESSSARLTVIPAATAACTRLRSNPTTMRTAVRARPLTILRSVSVCLPL